MIYTYIGTACLLKKKEKKIVAHIFFGQREGVKFLKDRWFVCLLPHFIYLSCFKRGVGGRIIMLDLWVIHNVEQFIYIP